MGLNPFTGKIEQTTPPLMFNPLAGGFQFSGGTNRTVFDPSSGGFEFAKAGGTPPFVGPLDGVLTDAVFAVAFGNRMVGAADPDIGILRNVNTAATQTFKATAGAFGADVTTFLAGSDGRYATAYDQIAGTAFVEGSLNTGGKAATSGVLEALGTGLAGAFAPINTMLSPAIFVVPQPYTLFVVVRLVARGINTGVLRFGAGTSYLGFNGTNWVVRSGGGSAINTGVAAALNTDLIVRVVVDGASSSITIDNGTPTTFNPGTTGIGSGGAETCTFGQGASGAMNGRIGFAGLWSGVKDDGAIDAALAGVY